MLCQCCLDLPAKSKSASSRLGFYAAVSWRCKKEIAQMPSRRKKRFVAAAPLVVANQSPVAKPIWAGLCDFTGFLDGTLGILCVDVDKSGQSFGSQLPTFLKYYYTSWCHMPVRDCDEVNRHRLERLLRKKEQKGIPAVARPASSLLKKVFSRSIAVTRRLQASRPPRRTAIAHCASGGHRLDLRSQRKFLLHMNF